MKGTPMRRTYERHAHGMHACEGYIYEMHAYERHIYERYTYERDTYERHAYERHIYERHAFEGHIYERHAHGRHAYEGASLGAVFGALSTAPLNRGPRRFRLLPPSFNGFEPPYASW